ncbi:MAG TPA: hypothetical protein VGL47_05070 [Amycolatopsis sp.]|uniref:hypothetical protein n=1 Tax=Amycolatopsis sp. TaxID=37632 RepID=UPI002F3FFF89
MNDSFRTLGAADGRAGGLAGWRAGGLAGWRAGGEAEQAGPGGPSGRRQRGRIHGSPQQERRE